MLHLTMTIKFNLIINYGGEDKNQSNIEAI